MKDFHSTSIEELQRENRWLKTVLDAIHEGVQLSNKEGVAVFYNKACERFEGLSREDVLGKKITEVYDVTEETSVHLNVLRTGKPVVEQYHQYNTSDGKRVDVIASTYPYYEGDEIVGVYSINRDVTKMKEFLDRTIELQKRLSSGKKSQVKSNGTCFTFDDIIGSSETIRQVIASARKIARNNSSVLIYGETGTGKELFAQSIHNASIYSGGPFIAINCAAIPETLLESLLFGAVKGAFTGAVEAPGLFEQAENGTLFLDEINSMGLHLQAKLLRVIQDKAVRRIGDSAQKTVNCRIISSTNKEPLEAVKDQQIRQDLYYRLAAVTLHIPPLRERSEDIAVLSKSFLSKYNKQFGTSIEKISNQLLELFLKHPWPGNVRELEHVIESAMNMVDFDEKTLNIERLPLYLRKRFDGQTYNYQALVKTNGNLSEMLQQVEKKIIEDTLGKNGGNISKTAQDLGIFRQALQYRIKRYNIKINEIKHFNTHY
ncbi:MAG: sigma 54-interacting transcriptional regulator [Desulfitobacterium hafniense]|nr:sigma 54-interacting transcriptional regulator [Desulfitobacterium hafniense]